MSDMSETVLNPVRKVLVRTDGQGDLPRYFSHVFGVARRMQHGRLDFVLPDGRCFRAQGAAPGPVAELHVHDPDIIARLVREGDLGFCEAYLDKGCSTPDLMALMDLVHAGNDELYDGFPGMGLLRAFERLRHWMNRNTKSQARRNIASHYDLGNEFYGLWLDGSMTYSSALLETGQESMEAGQRAKYAALVDAMAPNPAITCWRSAVAGAALPNTLQRNAGCVSRV